uniref:Tc1-like transposase DDE domain-containing protein n=1 Tax=Lepeophtheirus salmonis TaxID=72036 RepID=A0A0K2TUH7_LEPSM
MCLGVMASVGRKWFPSSSTNEKIRTEVLRWKILPWLKAYYPDITYVLIQDGAPSHTALKTHNFCKKHLADFWDNTFWPLSSPDHNPLDFSVWSVLSSKAEKT